LPVINALASVAVADLNSSRKWYEKLFERPADSTPMQEVAEWKFERGGWLQVYQSKERAGLGSVTFAVTSLAEQAVLLRSIGIDPGKEIITKTQKVLMIKDPDGNSIAFAEAVATA
jgi:hypothetical protein